MKTMKIAAHSVRRGDRIVTRGEQDSTLVCQVGGISGHLGGRELCLHFKEGSTLIVRRDAEIKVEEANRDARTEPYSRLSPDADEIIPGHIVAVFNGEGDIETEAIVVKVDDSSATVRLPGTNKRISRPISDIAHCDSPKVRETAARG